MPNLNLPHFKSSLYKNLPHLLPCFHFPEYLSQLLAHPTSAHGARARRGEPSVHTLSVESMLARQQRPLIALAEIIQADNAYSFVLLNFLLGDMDLARWE